jgi:hypothetical protein
MGNKAILNLSIDRDVLDQIKIKCGNISKLTEDYFKDYLGFEENRSTTQFQEVDTKISQLSAQLHELRNQKLLLTKEIDKNKPKVLKEETL